MHGNDKKIIASLKNDDEHALNQIFHLYFNRLSHFSTEFVKDKEVAREIVQDALFKFWQRRKHLRDETNILSYLFTVVRNLSLNYLRQFTRQNKVIVSDPMLVTELSLNYNILADQSWDHLLSEEMVSVIKKAIDLLPQKCKKVFELSRFEDLSNAEISEQLHISVKTVEGHITEALKSIRIYLAKYLL